MTRLALLAALMLSVAWCRAEGKAASAQDAAAVEAAANKAMQARYSKTVEGYVSRQSKKSGAFVVPDALLSREWSTKLVRIHKDRIVELSDGQFFACADFKEKAGDKKMLDLDFYVSKKGTDWIVDEVLLHKVEGKPRYIYNDNNERVPVPAP